VLSGDREYLSATLSQLIVLNKCPLISSVRPVQLHVLGAAVARIDGDLADIGEVALCNGHVQVGSQSLINTFIVFKNIFNDVIGLMDGVPLWILVRMLDF
jgi:hypothetical protein